MNFKALDGVRPNIAGSTYRYPGVGRWTRHLDPDRLELCEYGYHYTTGPQVLGWLGPTLYEAEPCPDHAPIHGDDKSVTCRLRLIRRFDGWNERTARLFAADCAERVLGVFEARFPTDGRPRAAIEAARAFANGLISADELKAAWAAALAAAWDAARDAALAAAWAARHAARAAARDAWDAARDAWDAAAWDAERDWQYQQLLTYLGVSDGE